MNVLSTKLSLWWLEITQVVIQWYNAIFYHPDKTIMPYTMWQKQNLHKVLTIQF